MVLRERRNIRHFTLVEILVVMAILAVLMGLGIGGYSLAMDSAKRAKTETLIKKLETALEAVKAKHGYYFQSSGADPITTNGMPFYHFAVPVDPDNPDTNVFPDTDALDTFVKTIDFESFKNANTKTVSVGGTDYLVVVDAWENPIYYSCPGSKNTGTFDIVSAGSDLKTANDDTTPVQDDELLWNSSTGKLNTDAHPENSNPKQSNDIANF